MNRINVMKMSKIDETEKQSLLKKAIETEKRKAEMQPFVTFMSILALIFALLSLFWSLSTY